MSFGSGRMSRAKKRGSEYERGSALSPVPASFQQPNGSEGPKEIIAASGADTVAHFESRSFEPRYYVS